MPPRPDRSWALPWALIVLALVLLARQLPLRGALRHAPADAMAASCVSAASARECPACPPALAPVAPAADASAERRALQRRMAPMLFPQLFRCLDATAVERATQGPAFSFEPNSQSHEDAYLWQHVFSAKGAAFAGATYVELGALDGREYSNTLRYEQLFGARGLLVEAHPGNSGRLRAAQADRPNSAIVTAAVCGLASGASGLGSLRFTKRGGLTAGGADVIDGKMLELYHGGKSAVDSEAPLVSCLPMQDLLDATGLLDINFLSLGASSGCRRGRGRAWGAPNSRNDPASPPHPHPTPPPADVEGAELLVLETIDLAVTNIEFALVELSGYNPPKDAAVRALLAAAGFVNSTIDPMKGCPNPLNGCMRNALFVNPQFAARKAARDASMPPPPHLAWGTGVQCP
jgi:hypothetical protein